jgi:cell division protein FtsZ
MAGAIQQELEFEVEPAPEPEPADPEPEPVEEEIEEPTMLDKWKQWLNNLIKDVAE